MMVCGAAPAAIALTPSYPGPVALVAAPWAGANAAFAASLQARQPILSISRDGRSVVVFVETEEALARVRALPGVIALRGDAASCAADAPSPFSAPQNRRTEP